MYQERNVLDRFSTSELKDIAHYFQISGLVLSLLVVVRGSISYVARREASARDAAATSGRHIDKKQHDQIAAAVRREPPIKFTVAFDGNDPEASVFAEDLIRSFEDGGAVVIRQPSAVFIDQRPLFGLLLQAAQGFDTAKIESDVSNAAPVGKNESLRNIQAQGRSDVLLYVGHKPQVL
jgi:hypothetical protein